jgi:hypothetical protein
LSVRALDGRAGHRPGGEEPPGRRRRRHVEAGRREERQRAGPRAQPGDDGDVRQSNDSFAGALAANKNATGQFAQQAQGDLGYGVLGIQAIGQKSKNDQDAEDDAKSIQIGATNVNAPVRVFSPAAAATSISATPRSRGRSR